MRRNGDSLGFSGGREKYAGITQPINGFDFLGLDIGNNKSRDFGRRPPPMTGSYACHNHSEVNG